MWFESMIVTKCRKVTETFEVPSRKFQHRI